ncbi:MAG: NADPH-dependent FMN reductase [Actinomycetota bacterium]
MSRPHVVGIGGTTRPGSSTERALRYALRTCEEHGVTTTLFAGADLADLPHYDPELTERAPGALRLLEEIRRADGLIIGSPGYHGSVSGMVKNAIDYTEDLRDDPTRCYLTGTPVGLIATGAGWQGTITTLEALRSIVHALRGWATPLGVAINSTMKVFNDDGDVVDDKARLQLETMAREVVEFIKLRRSALQPTN